MRPPLRHATFLARRFPCHSGALSYRLFHSQPDEKRAHDVILGTPSQVAYYSHHSPAEITFDTSMLRQMKNIAAMDIKEFDIQASFAEYAAQREANPFYQEDFYAQNKQLYHLHNLDDMLAACLWHGSTSSWRQADVIAPDSALMALMRGRGTFNASYVQGKLYLLLHLDPPVKKQPDLTRYCARPGFVHALTEPHIENAVNHPPDDNRYFTSVIKQHLGGLSLLTSTRMRAIQGNFTDDLSCYVYPHCKDKTVTTPGVHRLKYDFRKWHVHCLLLGIPTFLYGRRNGHVLKTVSVIDSARLARMGAVKEARWNVISTFNRGFNLLGSLRRHFQQQVDKRAYVNPRDDEDRIWRVQLHPGRIGFESREIHKGTKDWGDLMGSDEGTRIGIVPKALWHDLLAKSSSLLRT